MLSFKPAVIAGVATAALVLAGPIVAHAQSITYDQTIPTGDLDSSYNFAFTVPTFDTQGGLYTLTGVTLSLNTSITAEIDIANTSGTTHSYTSASAAIPVSVANTSGAGDSTAVAVTATATTGSGSVAAHSNVSIPGLTQTGSNTTNVTLGNLSAYIGTSGQTASFTATAQDGTYAGQGASGLLFGGSATGGGTFHITYTYTTNTATAPEPTSLAMAGAGFFGMAGGIFVRRRKRTA